MNPQLACINCLMKTSKATRVSIARYHQLCMNFRFVLLTLLGSLHSIFRTVFNLPDLQVVVLGDVDKLGKGDVIYAVYPDTTSFYQATVVQVPRKANPGAFVMVNFVDDSDEFGVTHDKAVPLKYIMMPPYGATM
jgi:hypothetical protein